ncbi:DNA polymerase I [Candidatus Uhrbacteria bacterium]|nr:DNA polymerase I [Candidatus Uhrbacteria bacterium]
MTTKNPLFVLLDGNALLHRAWHAIPPLTKPDGTVVNAVYGFAMVLEKLLTDQKPAYVAVAWDLPGKTFRHEMFEPYKAQRETKEQELYDQIPMIQDLLATFGIPSVSLPGYEADDIIGTLAEKAKEKQWQTMIVTGDLDSLQLVDKTTEVLFFVKGLSQTKRYDIDAVKERYGGLTPTELIEYKALRGDTSDNIPGVRGIGEKSAEELVGKYHSIEKMFEALKAGTLSSKYAQKLEGQEKTAEMARALVTIVRDLPLKIDLASTAISPTWDKVLAFYREYGFKTLIRRHENEPNPLQLPLGRGRVRGVVASKDEVKTVTETQFTEALTKLSGETVAFLLGEQPADLFGSRLSALCVSDGKTTLLLTHPSAESLRHLHDRLAHASHVATHDLKSSLKLYPFATDARWFDIMLAAYVLNPGTRGHDLPSIVNEYQHIQLPEWPRQFTVEKELRLLAQTTALLPGLKAILKKKLADEGAQPVFEDMEMPLVPILNKMEKTGISLDQSALTKLSKRLKHDLEQVAQDIYKAAGSTFNINSPSQLGQVLYEKLALPTKGIKRTKQGFSTAAPELEKMMDAHPVIPFISQYREWSKLQSTYVEALPSLIEQDGRIHTTYQQAVAATGRLSSKDPNLQNIPIKTELGNEIRKAFVAGRGKKLVSADYSQIELRLAAVIAKDKPFIQAFVDGADVHTRTAAEVWGVEEGRVTKEQRRAAKAINFGILYGMGSRSLAASTGMKQDEAKTFIETYFSIHTGIREYLDAMKAFAHEKGYVETLFGRRRYLPEIRGSVPQLIAQAERMAINMPIQGTAADLMKKAMIAVDGWLTASKWPAAMILQVHDEIVLEVDDDAVKSVAMGVREIMEGVTHWEVPLVVDVEQGDNWGGLKPIRS